jgi:hypothetical protein
MNKKSFLLFGCGTVILCITSLIVNNSLNNLLFPCLYTGQFLLFIGLLLTSSNKMLIFLSPSSLCFLYIIISNIMGSFAYNMGWVIYTETLHDFYSWKHSVASSIYFLLSGLFAILAFPLTRAKILYTQIIRCHPKYNSKIFHFLLLFFVTVSIALGIVINKGVSDYYSIPVTMFFICITYWFAKQNVKNRLFFYIFLLILMALISYNDKRNAIFFLFSISLIEFSKNEFTLKFKSVIVLVLVAIFFILMVIIMSILRGYGGYEINNVFIVFSYIPKYISNENFLKWIFVNLEFSPHFYFSHKAIDYIMNDNSLISYGSTIAKTLFILIPRSLVEIKPDSIIQLFTGTYDPAYRLAGGSDPINIYAEMFWNFGFFGLIPLLIILTIFNKLYFFAIRIIRNDRVLEFLFILFIYHEILFYFRGSGLDLFIDYIVIAFFINLILLIFSKNIFRKKSSLRNYTRSDLNRHSL